jgi:hypothetical protein
MFFAEYFKSIFHGILHGIMLNKVNDIGQRMKFTAFSAAKPDFSHLALILPSTHLMTVSLILRIAV